MRARKFGVERNRFLSVFFGDRLELLAEQHASGKQVAGRRIRRHIVHPGKSFACLDVVMSLYVAHAQHV